MRKEKVKADVRLKNFWRKSERFADLFNAVIFEGREIISPQDFQEMDTDMSGIIKMKDYEESVVRIRDVMKMTAYGVRFAVLGIENQQKIHYAMPLRTMLYDGLGYLKEYQEITRIWKMHGAKRTEDEFLSKMRKEDRLHPIITIVVYYGEKEWDGPLSLKDMIEDMPEEIQKIFPDYRMNLVQVLDSDKYTFHNEDVRTVFEISREIFRGNFRKISEKYRNKGIDSELAAVIGEITDFRECWKAPENEGVVNMCTALENLRLQCRQLGWREGVQEGWQEGRQKGLQEGHQAGLKEGRQAGLKEGHQAGLKEGRQAGLKEGHQAGLKEGHQIGLQDGRQEGIKQRNREIILRMMDKGYSVIDIAVLLEMPEDEIYEVLK